MTEYQQRQLFVLLSIGWHIADQFTENGMAFYAVSNGQGRQAIVAPTETTHYKWEL